MPQIEENLMLRSEEVQEIISKPPAWLIRWGITLVFLMVLLVLIFSFLIKYPDYVQANVMVTTNQPAEKIIAKRSGQIDEILVTNGQNIDQGQALAVYKSTANFKHVVTLKETLDSFPLTQEHHYTFPLEKIMNLTLGEIASAYFIFEKNYRDYQLQQELQNHQVEIFGKEQSMLEIKGRINNLMIQKELLEKRQALVKIDYERNLSLYKEKVIASKDFENKEMEYLQIQEQVNQMVIGISQLKEAYDQANFNQISLLNRKRENESKILIDLIQSYYALKRALIEWEYNHLITASIGGTISFQKVWGSNQSINSGDLIFTLLPQNTSDLIGIMKISSQNAGKVSVGQRVLIKLDNYGFQQFGALQGEITSIAVSPDEELNYLVYANLPKGMVTTFNIEIPFNQELLGNADIITEELSIAQRLFFKFRSLIVN